MVSIHKTIKRWVLFSVTGTGLGFRVTKPNPCTRAVVRQAFGSAARRRLAAATAAAVAGDSATLDEAGISRDAM